MKFLFSAVVFFLSVSLISRADYASEVMSDGPEAYYRFEESAGATSIEDSSGNGHGSKTVSNVVFGQPGGVGSGGLFSNAYVQLDLQLSPSIGDFSIETLANFDITDINRHIASQQDGTGQGRSLFYRAADGKMCSYLGGSTTISSSAASEGTWHHVVMTVEDGGATDTIRFYIDGQPSGSATETVEFAGGDWVLGAAKEFNSLLIGALDEVAIYTKFLSEERIMAHYQEFVPSIDIATASTNDSWTTTAYSISGIANDAVTGTMAWSNSANGETGIFLATSPWTVNDIPLAYGTNTITVSGTNQLGMGASDSVQIVRDPAPPVVIDITTVNTTVFHEVTTCIIAGTNNAWVVGMMSWTNPATGAGGAWQVAGSVWQVVDVELAFGANAITVFGTNAVGDIISDSVTITRSWEHGGISPIHYVSTNGSSIWPYTNWVTAATSIQDAVDAAVSNETVLVTNGTYTSTSEITVFKAITIESVNGRDVTIVDGRNAHRLIYLSTGAVVDGFSFVNGRVTGKGGGIYCNGAATVKNCLVNENSALGNNGSGGGIYCTTTDSIITNCTLMGNWSGRYGGGSYRGTLTDCTLTGNTGYGTGGGGSFRSTLNHCTLTDNWSGFMGGGSYEGTLNNCTLMGNFAHNGGGGSGYGTLNNCTLRGNSTKGEGGGSSFSTLNNCTIIGNSATGFDDYGSYGNGGGSYEGTLNNCTIVSNSARYAGGCSQGTLNNCIVYYNTATVGGDNWSDYEIDLSFCCTTPLPEGNGNISADPQFVNVGTGNYRLHQTSPCRDAGNNGYVLASTDLDGYTRVFNGTVDMGAYEYHEGLYAVPSPIHYVSLDSSEPRWPYTSWATAAHTMQNAVDTAQDGDSILVSNGVYSVGGASVEGMSNRVALTRPIALQSVNGAQETVLMGVADPASANGPGAMRCAYLVAGATLSGFTLTNGHTHAAGDYDTERSGGGVLLDGGGMVSDCIIAGNSADALGGGVHCLFDGTVADSVLRGNTAFRGGGACMVFGGVIERCVLTANSAQLYGGGIYFDDGGSLINSLVTDNVSVLYGGGAYIYRFGSAQHCNFIGNHAGDSGGGTYVLDGIAANFFNCIVWDNMAYNGGRNWDGDGMPALWENCCTLPTMGKGCVTANPQFVDPASGNHRLQPASPCIDAGTGAAGAPDDLNGTPRPLDGDANGSAIVDIGAYEYFNAVADSDGDTMRDGWESDNGLNIVVADGLDNPDKDPYTNAEEHTLDFNPNVSNAYFRITSISNNSPCTVYFESSALRDYTLLGRTNLTVGTWQPLVGPRTGVGGADSMTNSVSSPANFYKVRVELP